MRIKSACALPFLLGYPYAGGVRLTDRGWKLNRTRDINHRGAVAQRRTYFDNCVSQHLSGAGSSPAGAVGRDLNL